MNFDDWNILKELNKKFLDTVEMAYVFGEFNMVYQVNFEDGVRPFSVYSMIKSSSLTVYEYATRKSFYVLPF